MFKHTIGALCCLVIAFSQLALAETSTSNKHTKVLAEDQAPAKAKIEEVAWIAGDWQGEIWGGHFEETWSRPSAGSMQAAFKFSENNQVKFYELMTISEHNNSLILRLKHFGPELKGWEEKDQSVSFKLVELAPQTAYFEGYTFKKISPDSMHVYVVIDNQGQKQETLFKFNRKPAQ
ncbi:DUF6265 family protein [Paraglaciecola aestuariivivens]